ncbi:Myc-type basic helix-loop-helix (bHLH) domain [Arabidopsis suecica]|uniref:Myc-type basic helix-loop-helix (BHLH) domain n=1 Tax=Arabidopsis suecica TaxID=45249 RepID=A0A8T2EB52_ARASU|nr:Myc-type basic helix-loop-helix (bHLH) domain [Arabidopsis suecica]
MTEEFDTTGVCTGTWWSSSNGMFSGCSLPRSAEIVVDFGQIEWQNIDTLDAKTYNENYLSTSTFLGNANLDTTSQIYVSSPSNVHEEERYNQINSFLEGLFDSSEQLLVPNCPKPELFESFHFFDDVFPNESRMISVFDHQKPKEDMQACKSLTTCKRASEKSGELEDIESSQPLKRPRLETPSHFPSFKVRKEKLGDRITALQQLVSPFGKTDTASVLHDAIDYIKFLQEQITEKVSTSPHLNSIGSGEQKQWSDESSNNTHNQDCSPRQDLRSRGLCLMPISSTFSTPPQHLDTSSFWN